MERKKFGTGKNFHDWTFSERVEYLALLVPAGRVTTYGDLAKAAGGGALSAQSITSILGKAYDRGVTAIPFHRIVYADGRIWVDETHRERRRQLYRAENIELDERDRVKDFAEKRFDFKTLKPPRRT
jgi:methylated-DNA-protein-cysteine methyltransferase related protein